MNINELQHMIEIHKLNNQADEMGGEVQNWELLCMVWAKIESRSNYAYEHFQEGSKESLKITIRYLELDKDNIRIRYRNKNYKILSMDNVELKNEILVLNCEEE